MFWMTQPRTIVVPKMPATESMMPITPKIKIIMQKTIFSSK
jgi:hypothetical protein